MYHKNDKYDLNICVNIVDYFLSFYFKNKAHNSIQDNGIFQEIASGNGENEEIFNWYKVSMIQDKF